MKNIHFYFWILLILNVPNSISQTQIYWSDIFNGTISTRQLGTAQPTTDILSQDQPNYHSIDRTNQKIYWTNDNTKSIEVINYDGTNRTTLIQNLSDPLGIEVLPEENKIYLIDDDKIALYDLSGNFIKDILTNLDIPRDLAVAGHYIYWTSNANQTVNKVNIEGTDAKVLVTNAFAPLNIEVDTLANAVYWSQNTASSSVRGVFKTDLNGDTAVERLSDKSVNGFTVDGTNGFLYYSESIFNGVYRVNLNTQDSERLISDNVFSPGGVSIDTSNNKIIWIDNGFADFLFSANLTDGRNIRTIETSDVYFPTRFEVDTTNKKIYWVNSRSSFSSDRSAKISRADLDGNNIELLISINEVDRPFGISLDIENNKLYWTDINDSTIKSANLDGSNITEVLDASDGLINPNGILVDKINSKLYWTDWGSGKVQRSNLDGTDIEDIATGIRFPYEVDISHDEGKIYWTENGNGRIQRANLDGSEIEDFLLMPDTVRNRPNSLFIDQKNKRLFYSIDFSGEKIQSIFLDRINPPEDIITTNLNSPHDIYVESELLPTSLNEITLNAEENKINVYPNPTRDFISVESKTEIRNFQLYNSAGVKVLNIHSNQFYLTANISELPSGFYSAIIELKNGVVKNQKIYIVK